MLNVLILDDSPDDAELVVLELERGGFELRWERIDNAAALHTALDKQPWNLVIADHSMPHFSAQSALELVKARGISIPFIIVSGTISDNAAAQIMKAGARDFIAKTNLARLAPSVRRVLEEAHAARERRRIQEELESLRRRNELILHSAGEGICGLDANGRITFINPAAARILGYGMEELLGCSLEDLLYTPHPVR
ncbi:MAG TPA: response regulator, partial [Gammaproteobacteria bacterium]|nr:response regulator [Gammaproteobacteria bacterium]